ncbi:hypothetical protein DSM106972_038800 [Dulcicalothrix desertica PCC 7102]|uniref:Uncharacterized protein n=1 Tax=Dulcicalothrix desertica PCC 7102 TaxID=232991 RepID=A0A3S1CJX6_9CYAN|nr:hypothetical protein [Dulcicalothrix desertica]RUT05059.1 hypothetical protein DSM106972_038800 [Dulcicalothrix desertica PCC 7102]TWH62601.1 hypothetical protein CAL7102_00094 [Dulcicalothrix desertica PCC 7102]
MNLWNIQGFPKRDWKHVDVYDIAEGDPEAPLHKCEACGREEVRYVHELEHDLWDEAIEVGCICAGRLTGDIEEAKLLEKETRNRTGRRNNWLQRKWKKSGKGNLYLKFRHRGVRYHIVVFQSKYGQWNFRATLEAPGYLLDDPSPFAPVNPLAGGFKTKKYNGTKWHKTLAQAQIAAFDAFF